MVSRKYKIWTYAAVGLAIAAFIAGGLLLHRCDRAETLDLAAYPVRGIDVSAHNGEIDFRKVAADSISFVYIKATEGADFCDTRFHRNYYAAREAGLRVGAYHFFRFDRPGDMQAINLLQAVRGLPLDLPLAIDVEEWTNPAEFAPANVMNSLSDMADYLRRRGVEVVLYSNKKDYERYLRRNFDHYRLWICSFTTPDSLIDWTFWQYSHRGNVKGIDSKVDMNVFRGTLADLDSLRQQR